MVMNAPEPGRSAAESGLNLIRGRPPAGTRSGPHADGGERTGFADVLRQASPRDPRRQPAPAEPLRPLRPLPSADDDRRTETTDSPEARPRRREQQPDAVEPETDPPPDEPTEAAADPAAAAANVPPVGVGDEEVGGEDVTLPRPARAAYPWQVQDVGKGDGAGRGAQEVPLRIQPVPAGEEALLETDLGQPRRAHALDLLTPQDLVEGDIQVEGEGGEVMERLQEALASGNRSAVDDLGKPLVPQVVRTLAALARNGVSEMRLQLQPRDLGDIELRVRAVEGVVRGDVMVQHLEVKHLLESQLARLRAALESHGLHLEGFDVGVAADGAFARDGDPPPEVPFRGGGGARRAADVPAGIEESRAFAGPPRRPVRLDPDAVDWIV